MATGLGIDIGSEWIKIAQVRCAAHSVTVTGALKIPRSGSPKGLDLPPDESSDGALVVPPNLGQELARAGLRRRGTLGVSGREVMLKYVSTPPMTPDKLRMFIDMQVGERLVPGRKGEGSGAPAVTYDFRLLNIPTGLKGDLVVMAGVAKNEYLYGVFSALKSAGIRATRTTPSAFGLVHAYLRTQKVPPGETVVLVDVGHELLEIAILAEENLYFARSAPGGGKKFDQALDKLLKLGPDKIQEFKHHRARIQAEGAKTQTPQELQFQKALQEGADVVANAIRSAVMFCRTQAKMPSLDYQRVFLSGGGGRLNGLREYLEHRIKRPVQTLDLYTGLDLRKLDAASARCFEGEVPDMAVALGLAVIDAQPKCFHFALVPEGIVRRRRFWTKTVFAAAAGVVLMAGLYLPHRSAEAAKAQAAAEALRFGKLADEAKKRKKEFEQRKVENQKLAQQTDFYARQTRLGLVYLNLFTQVRENAPRGLTLVSLGPSGEDGGRGSNVGSGDYFTNPMRDVQVRGFYDADQIKNFNDTMSRFFKDLKEVAGVEGAQLDLTYNDKDQNLAPGLKGFQFSLRLANPDRPVVVAKVESAAPGGAAPKGPAPGPAKKD